MIVTVKNHKGHYEANNHGYESWLDYWKEGKGIKATECSNVDCNSNSSNSDLVGGHVDYNNHIYIVPICKDCNNQGSNFSFKVYFSNLLLFK